MRQFLQHEPKRQAGAESDSPHVNQQGAQAKERTGHQPSRGIGGEPKRSGSKTAGTANSPPRLNPHDLGQTASRQTARRVNLPSGGRFSNITENVRKYAAEQANSEKDALQRVMAEKSKEFVEAGAEVYAKA